MALPRGVLRIGEVSRRTGVAVPTLRAWERRYGLLEPDRTEGGHRLYGEADIQRVTTMVRLLDEGWSAAAAAREIRREPATVVPLRSFDGGEPTAADALVQRLVAAINAFDGPAADQVVDDVFARFEVPRALDEVLLPVLRRIGDGWQQDPRVIAREHFATNTLRPRLQRLLHSMSAGTGYACLAAAPEGEDHDLGLLAGCAVAARAGWRVHYLGARTPTRAMERSVAQLRPQTVLIAALFRSHADAFLADEPNFGDAAIVLGGPGFVAADTQRLANGVLHEGPLSGLPATLERAMSTRHRVV